MSASNPPVTVFTIGHSTRSADLFMRTLQAHQIEQVVDVRTVPRSRRNPQFNQETLSAALAAAGIRYAAMKGLGGWRRGRSDSVNTGWRSESFRAYADYMATPEFDASLRALIELARDKRTAIMCAEAVPWRCHRSLISDALTVRGIKVEHIMSLKRRQPHQLTAWAQVDELRITYPARQPEAGPATGCGE